MHRLRSYGVIAGSQLCDAEHGRRRESRRITRTVVSAFKCSEATFQRGDSRVCRAAVGESFVLADRLLSISCRLVNRCQQRARGWIGHGARVQCERVEAVCSHNSPPSEVCSDEAKTDWTRAGKRKTPRLRVRGVSDESSNILHGSLAVFNVEQVAFKSPRRIFQRKRGRRYLTAGQSLSTLRSFLLLTVVQRGTMMRRTLKESSQSLSLTTSSTRTPPEKFRVDQ